MIGRAKSWITTALARRWNVTPLGQRFRAVIIVAVAALLVVGIAAARHGDWHGPPRSQVVGVWLQPLEGPGGYPFTSPAAAPWAIFNPARPLASILPDIPDPLPRPSSQWFCFTKSGYVAVLLSGGRTIQYGPCRRPDSINRLLSSMKGQWGAQ
jgi:hypothetical protein